MPKAELVVHAGPYSRRDCPVIAEVPLSRADAAGGVELTSADGTLIPAQLSPGHPFPAVVRDPSRLQLAFILPELAAGETLRLTARLGGGRPAPERVQVSDDGAGQVTVTVAGEPLTIYRYLGNPARPCFFPLVGPGGAGVTRSWPISDDVPGEAQDHRHHRSLWVAHGDVNGSDNWSEEEGHGFQVHREMLACEGGPVLGLVAAANDWTDRAGRKIVEERRALTAYAVSGEARVLDLDVRFTATECDVRFGDTKEGGILAMRVAPSMDGEHGGRIENSYGAVGEGECWGRQAQWCDYAGEVGGETVGIAIFDHPRSFRHPTHWHVRDYGMYTANPFGWHDFTGDPAVDGSHVLPRGASLLFHYRIYLHRGGTAEARVGDRYHDYAHPPRVEVPGEPRG
jgi:hypothetical protein